MKEATTKVNDPETAKDEMTMLDEDPAEMQDPFQDIMEKAGTHGRFQLFYNIIFVGAMGMAGAMIYMNIILALNVPDHWCTIAGRENTNYTLDEWRDITLPREKDNRGAIKYSSCKMYDVNYTEIENWQELDWNKTTFADYNETACRNGWTYDKMWYEDTIPTKEDWVCERDLFVTNVFVVSRVIEVLGSFVLGQMGDIYGRRIVFYISVLMCSLGRFFSIVTTGQYIWFLIFSGISGFPANSLFQAPLIVGMEISREDDRSLIAMYQSFGWSFGTTFMPLLFWWLRDWEAFMWITSIPTALILIFFKYIIESPRWLLNKGRYKDAIKEFKKIASINGMKFDVTENEIRKLYINAKQEVTYGMASLFDGWRLIRNTTIMGFSWCVVAVSYFTLVLFSSLMGGNPFLNFLLQSIVEIPAYMVGKYLGDKYGRRFTNSMSFLVSFLVCIPVIILATDEKQETAMMALAAFIKFLNALTFFTVNLQSMEIYPTCMRQTGIALGTILANGVGIVAPYLVYLGTSYDIRCPYIILGTLFLIGGIGATFLPETLHKKLPDTMEEARNFGIHDKYFSLPKPPHKDVEAADEKLNQKQYAP